MTLNIFLIQGLNIFYEEDRNMKIYGGQGLIHNQTDKSDKKNISENNDFKAIMDQLISTSANKSANIPANIQTPFAGGVGVVIKEEPIESSCDTGNKEEVLNTLKDTLDLVDFYAGKLSDSSISTDNLASLVENMEQRLDTLKGMESSTETNEKLKPIISDLTTTMGVEIEKFKRGDYV
jgi:hypothetical protein